MVSQAGRRLGCIRLPYIIHVSYKDDTIYSTDTLHNLANLASISLVGDLHHHFPVSVHMVC